MKIKVYHPVTPWIYEIDLDRGKFLLLSWPSVWDQYRDSWDEDEEVVGYCIPLEQASQYFLSNYVSPEFWDWIPEQ